MSYTKDRAPSAAKSARIELRTSPQTKELVEKAASLSGMSVSDYISGHIQAAAVETIGKIRLSQLSTADIEILKQLLSEPREENLKLKQVVEEHKKKYGEAIHSPLTIKPRNRTV